MTRMQTLLNLWLSRVATVSPAVPPPTIICELYSVEARCDHEFHAGNSQNHIPSDFQNRQRAGGCQRYPLETEQL